MKTILFLPVLIFALMGYRQPSKDLRFEEVGWTIHIPANTPALDQGQIDSLMRAGSDKIKKQLGTDLDLTVQRSLFAFLDKQYNAFAAAISPFDSTQYSSWRSYHEIVKSQAMQLIISMSPRVRILDSAGSEETIDGIPCQVMYFKTYYPENQVTMQTYWFACLRKGYDLSINMMYTDKTKGQEFLDIIRHSSFKQ